MLKMLDEDSLVRAIEEIGDLFWFIVIICKNLNLDMQDIMEKNIKNLKVQYLNKFTEDKVIK